MHFLLQPFLFCTFLMNFRKVPSALFCCFAFLTTSHHHCLKNSVPSFPLKFCLLPAGRMWSGIFPALFYFEICVFKKMNQLLSSMWPLFKTAQHCFKQSAEDYSATASKGIIKRSLCCLVVSSVDQYTTTFFSGNRRVTQEKWRDKPLKVTQAWGCNELQQ